MNVIWLLLRASWVQMLIAVFAGLVSGGCTARLIALINSAASNAVTGALVWQFVVLVLLVASSSIVSQLLLINLAQDAVLRLRMRLSQGILSSPLRHLEQLGASRLMATLTDDVATLSATVFAIPFLCVDIAIICGCLLYLAWLSSGMFAFTVGFIMVGVGSIQLLINRAGNFLNLAREEQDNLFKHFRAITEGVKELKLHTARRQEFLSEDLQASATASRNYNVAAMTTFSISSGWGNVLFFSLVGLLLFALPRVMGIPVAVSSAYILTLTYMMLPMQSILSKLQELFRAGVSLQKIERMGLALASQTERNLAQDSTPKPDWSKLELKQITHTYPGEKEDSHFILGPLSLSFYPGEIVFIVGGNGSGKSTLAKIITGLYSPETGKMRLNGKVITEDNREWYRQHFSVVFSDFYLFDRLLGIGNPFLETQATEYLRELNLDGKVQVENGKFSTINLSQGQRKRLALLTAYLENRPIYLFDEWASDQDPVFREIFYKEILSNLKKRGKTVFVISHDDHYFHLADRVIKLDYGQVEYDKVNSL